MAGTETQTSNEESRCFDHDTGVESTGTKPISAREQKLFRMSTVRTFCALFGAVSQAISVCIMIYLLLHRH